MFSEARTVLLQGSIHLFLNQIFSVHLDTLQTKIPFKRGYSSSLVINDVMSMAAATPNSGTGVRVLNERGISTTEMEQQLHDFLRKPHVKEGLSSEDYTRLQALKKALKQECQEGVDKLIKPGQVTS